MSNPITFDDFDRLPIYIGYRGENLVTGLDVDLSGVLLDGWTAKLRMQRPNETLVYPKDGTLTDSIYHVTFSAYDTANIGRGEAVIELYGADGELKKSATTSTVIEYSLATGGGPPGPLDIYRTAEQQDVIDAGKLSKAAQAEKTEEMTQPVGVDDDGKLWALSGGGSGGKVWRPTVDESTGVISWEESAETTPPEPKNIRGPQGNSGVYVGSGQIPEGYNVKIDPDGELEPLDADTLGGHAADYFLSREKAEEVAHWAEQLITAQVQARVGLLDAETATLSYNQYVDGTSYILPCEAGKSYSAKTFGVPFDRRSWAFFAEYPEVGDTTTEFVMANTSGTASTVAAPITGYAAFCGYNAYHPEYLAGVVIAEGDTPPASNDPTTAIDRVARQITDRVKSITGHTILTIGDSLTNIAGVPDGVRWQNILVDNLGFSGFSKTGAIGLTIAEHGDNSIYSHVMELEADSDVDLVTLLGGTNDWSGSITLGDFDEQADPTTRDSTTFIGAAFDIAEKLLTLYPTTPIIMIGTTQRVLNADTGADSNNTANSNGDYLIEYVDALRKVASYFSIPFCDLYRESGITAKNITHYMWAQSHDGQDDTHYLHLSDAGEEQIARRLIRFIRSVF